MSLATSSLAEIAEVAAGGGAPQNADAFTAKGTPFVRAGSLKPLVNGASESTLEQLTDEVAKEHGLRKFPPNTVVFAKSGMSATKGHVYRLRSEAYVVNHLAALIPSERIVPQFLEHALRVYSPVRLIKDAAYPSVRLSDVETMKIPLPPLPEQRRIATALDKADELRAKRRTALAELDSLIQAIFLEMFGDPATNSKGLPTISLGRLGNWASGGTPPRGRGEYFSGDVPWFSSGELEKMFVSESKERISELALEQTAAKLVPKGALMLGMYDTAALKASIAGVACSCNQAIAFATVDAAIAHTIFVYFAIVIGREHFRRLQRGVRQKNLNLTMVREISIPKPPLTLQHDFARRVAAVEDLKSKHATTLAELDDLFASLQHRAFRGEL